MTHILYISGLWLTFYIFQGYEVRRYPASKWVSHTVSSSDYNTAVGESFNKLFLYIDGGNDKGK